MIRRTKILIGLIVGLLVVGAFLAREKMTYSYGTVIFKKSGDMVQVWIPSNDAASRNGLIGKRVLPEDYGMLWEFNPAQKPPFTMKRMRIALDFVYIRDGKIVEIKSDIPVDRALITPTVDVTQVLEVGSGYALRHKLKVGDLVEIQKNAWSGK